VPALASRSWVWQFFGMAEVLDPIQIHIPPALDMNDEQFFNFCQLNGDLRIERTSDGDILIMTPEAGSSSHGSARLTRFFDEWAEKEGSGQIFGSSAGFILPNGAMRSPDIAWVKNSRLKKISDQDWNKFLPLCPDFVLELRSPTDRLKTLQDKMQEYIANGARLGWLLDPFEHEVHIYRPKFAPKLLKNPGQISAAPVLPNFILDVRKIWAAMERKS
jgi:Uma2 family endonuclease